MFPEFFMWADDMVESVAIKPEALPFFCSIDDVLSCFWIVEVEFWQLVDTKESFVFVWIFCKDKPVFVGAFWVVLCFNKIRVCVATVVGDKISDDFDVIVVAGMDE